MSILRVNIINVVVMVTTGSQGSQDEHRGWLILRLRKEDARLEQVLHIRRVGPGDKGLTYQAWDSLFIYHNYLISFIKLLPSECCDSYTQPGKLRHRETSPSQSTTPGCALLTVLVNHPDILLTTDP